MSFSSDEIEKTSQLRLRVSKDYHLKDDQLTDHYMIRWLRARNMDLAKAEEMLRLSLKWREDENIETILETMVVPEGMLEQMPFAYLGDDPATGCPVFLYLMGRDDFKGKIERYGVDFMNRINAYFMEHVQKVIFKKCSEKSGRTITQFIELVDLEGFSYGQLASSKYREGIMKLQTFMDNNYPEVIYHVSMVNAPKVFYFLYNFMKPFVAKATLDKVTIHGPTGWKEKLEERFPLDLLPPNWGGRRQGQDEYCSGDSSIWIFGLSKNFFKDQERLKIGARDRVHLEFDVRHTGSSLVWKFKSESHDISFGILHEEEEVIPLSRVDAHKEVQTGELLCHRAGKYFVVFDNTYSYTKTKYVHHHIEIVAPSLIPG